MSTLAIVAIVLASYLALRLVLKVAYSAGYLSAVDYYEAILADVADELDAERAKKEDAIEMLTEELRKE